MPTTSCPGNTKPLAWVVKGRRNGGRGQAPERIAPPLFGIHATARALLPGSEGAESSPEQVGGLLERQVPHGLRLLRVREVGP